MDIMTGIGLVCGVIVIATLIGLRSTPSPTFVATAHGGVQQPVFVGTSDHMIASASVPLRREGRDR